MKAASIEMSPKQRPAELKPVTRQALKRKVKNTTFNLNRTAIFNEYFFQFNSNIPISQSSSSSGSQNQAIPAHNTQNTHTQVQQNQPDVSNFGRYFKAIKSDYDVAEALKMPNKFSFIFIL